MLSRPSEVLRIGVCSGLLPIVVAIPVTAPAGLHTGCVRSFGQPLLALLKKSLGCCVGDVESAIANGREEAAALGVGICFPFRRELLPLFLV